MTLSDQRPKPMHSPDWGEKGAPVDTALLTEIFGNSAVGIIILDRNIHIAWTNKLVPQLFGIPQGELLGQEKRRLVQDKLKFIFADPEDFAAHVMSGYERNDHVEDFECHVVAGDGRKERWLRHWSQPISGGAFAGGRIEYYIDISARKEAEQVAQSEHTLLAGLAESILDAVVIVSRDGKFVYYNQRFLDLWKFPGPILESRSDERALEWAAQQTPDPTAFLERVRCIYRDFKHSAREEIRLTDGRVFERFGSVVHNKEEHLYAWIWTFRDVTEQQKAAQALQESERKHHFLTNFYESTRGLSDARGIMVQAARLLGEHLNVSRCAYADVEPDGNHFTIQGDYTNGCASVVGKYQLSLFGPRAMSDLHGGRSLVIHDVDRELAPDEGANMFNAISIKAIICCPLVKDGRLRAMMAVHQTTPRRWTDAEVKLVEAVVERCWATVERARAEQALRQSEERLRLIMDNVKDFAIISFDLEGRGLSWNPGAEELFGYTADEVIGINLDILFTPEDRAQGAPQQERETALKEGCAVDERWHLRKNGERFFASGAARPYFDPFGQPLGFIKVARDITRRKQTEDELRHARENLQHIVQERTAELEAKVAELEAFSYSVSHDLRAPLRAMQGYSHLLIDDYGDKLDDVGRDYVRRIKNAAERLDRLVQDILTYSRVVRTAHDLHPVNVAKLIEEVIHGYPSLHANGAEIKVHGPLHNVLGHEGSLTQCISNLLGNAVKFVPPNRTPRVDVWSEERDGMVRIYFKDNGIGIAPRNQERVFRMFEKAEPVSSYEGTGIGLAIVRKAVERMNGSVGLESEPGAGSTFWLELRKA